MIRLTTVFAILFVLLSCKKGKDDNFLSLRSRDARLKGEWKVEEYRHFTEYDSIVFEQGTYRHYEDGVLEDEYPYSLYYTFEKGGAGSLTESVDGESGSVKFNWVWTDDNKKKSGLHILNAGQFKVNRLTSKEMVLEVSYIEQDGSNTSKYYSYLSLTKQ